MEPSCLAYALTDDERNAFDRDGYLIFDNMLSPAHVDALIEVSDRVDAKEREKNGVGPFARQTVRDMIWRDPLFLELVDLPQALAVPPEPFNQARRMVEDVCFLWHVSAVPSSRKELRQVRLKARPRARRASGNARDVVLVHEDAERRPAMLRGHGVRRVVRLRRALQQGRRT